MGGIVLAGRAGTTGARARFHEFSDDNALAFAARA
jgi:hypothetical protein